MIAVIRGPYSHRRGHPSGAAPQVVVPQLQRRAMSWCSVTRTVIGGKSNTCRRSIPASGASDKSAPHPVHGPGSCRFHSFGLSTSASVAPGCPGCPPGVFPLLRRSDLGAGLANGESDDGGLDEFRLFCPSYRFNSAFSARTSAISACNRSISSACCTTRAASS
jgi:hypothetical protein